MSASERGRPESPPPGASVRPPGGSVPGRDPDGLEKGLGWLLLVATVVASGCFAVALVWPPAADIGGTAGVAVLLGAPFAVILAAGFLYARARAWVLAAITLLLMAILAVGLWIQSG